MLLRNPSISISRIKEIAVEGFAGAQFQMGRLYLSGVKFLNKGKEVEYLLEPNSGRSIVNFHLASSQGHTLATYFLGLCYSRGIGVSIDRVKASRLLRFCVVELEKAALEGNAEAMSLLGGAFLWGLGVPENPEKAFQMFKKAAVDAHPGAKFMVGLCLYDGIGVKSQKEGEIHPHMWFDLASHRKHGTAELALADCYLRGFETRVDRKKAQDLYLMGLLHMDESDPIGQCYKAQFLYFGFGKDRENDINEAISLWKASAENGYWRSQCWLGLCYFKGIQMEKNSEMAQKLWAKASEKGYWLGKRLTGTCFLLGEGVPKNEGLGVKLWLESQVHYQKLTSKHKFCMDWILSEFGILRKAEVSLYF